jgi:hypothetical protein
MAVFDFFVDKTAFQPRFCTVLHHIVQLNFKLRPDYSILTFQMQRQLRQNGRQQYTPCTLLLIPNNVQRAWANASLRYFL